MTPAGIEPATFRFVAQHLNHCATAVPKLNYTEENFFISYYLHYKSQTDWPGSNLVLRAEKLRTS